LPRKANIKRPVRKPSPPFALTTDMKKQNPERLAALVTNYAEPKQAFAGSEWQSFFEE